MNTEKAKTRLEEVIHNRMQHNAGTIVDALNFTPRNYTAPVTDTSWRVSPGGAVEMVFGLPTEVEPNGQVPVPNTLALPAHEHAVSQLTSITGVNKPFLDKLRRTPAHWAKQLAAHNLNETWKHLVDPKGKPPAFLARSDTRGGEAIKAIVSSSYATIDVRPTLLDFLTACGEYGVQPYHARPGDINFALKMILPKVFVVAGDPFAIGLEMRNTDWGGTAVSVGVFFERLVCLNGMTSDKIFRQTHRGAKRDRSIDWSDQTLNLDRQAAISAMRDVVRGFFEPANLDGLIAQLTAAGTINITADALEARVNKRLPKDTTQAVLNLFNSADNVRMPERPTWMRAAQAVSAAAQDAEKLLVEQGKEAVETVLLMERLAGDLMTEGARRAA